jgi:hypothetical protein
MAAKNDVFDFQVDDGVFDDCEGIEIGGCDYVCDVTVYEDFSWLETEEGCFWDSRIGAS